METSSRIQTLCSECDGLGAQDCGDLGRIREARSSRCRIGFVELEEKALSLSRPIIDRAVDIFCKTMAFIWFNAVSWSSIRTDRREKFAYDCEFFKAAVLRKEGDKSVRVERG